MLTRASTPFFKRILSAVAAGLAFAALPMAAMAQHKVVFGTPGSLADGSAAIAVAIDQGFYKEAGIDAQIIDFKGGAPAIQALLANGIQYAIASPEHVIRLRSRGRDGIVAFALDTRHIYSLVSLNSSPVKSFKDLKGRKVGITSAGSLTDNLVRLEAKREGLRADADFQVISVGAGAPQKAALDTGRVDATTLTTLDLLQFASNGNYRIAFDWRTQQVPSLALVALASYQNANPEVARAVLTATLKGQQVARTDKLAAIKALSRVYPSIGVDVIAKVAETLPARLSPDGLYTRAQFDALQRDVLDIDPSLKAVDFTVAVPGTFLK